MIRKRAILCEFIIVQISVVGHDQKSTYSATNAIQLDVMRLLLQIYLCLEPIMIARLSEKSSWKSGQFFSYLYVFDHRVR